MNYYHELFQLVIVCVTFAKQQYIVETEEEEEEAGARHDPSLLYP